MDNSSDDNALKRTLNLSPSAFKTLARPLRRFTEAMFETGDATTAYLESHPDCKSLQSAKYRGRQLLRRGDIQAAIASLKQEASGNQGINSRKGAVLAELETLAFAKVNVKKLHPKEKLSALRQIAELEGLLAPKPASTGIRATFHFDLGGRAAISASGRGSNRASQIVDVDIPAEGQGNARSPQSTEVVSQSDQPLTPETSQTPATSYDDENEQR